MNTIFLTSSLGTYEKVIVGEETIKKPIKSNNSNHFIDRLKLASPKINTFVFVASDPNIYEITDSYSELTKNSLNLDGFDIKNFIVVDSRFVGDIEKTILSADVVFLAGGNVPTQNKYFNNINMKSILEKYNGVLIGQSAGSMNCAKIVYAPPEEPEEFEDKNYQRIIPGLGLVDFAVMPHMNDAQVQDEFGHPTVMQMCLEDSFAIPHFGICDYGFIEIKNNIATAYGKTFLIKNGKCIELCGDGERVELSKNMLNNNEIIKQLQEKA